MDMLAAMEETIAIAKGRRYDKQTNIENDISQEHFESMLSRMRAGMAEGYFSEAKQGRWLGYIQGVLVARGFLSLEEAKEINKKFAGK